MKKVRFVGLDVHAETIAVAVAEPDGEVRSLGAIPNRPESVRKLMKKLGPATQLRVCYEAGPTGYVLYWQLTALGVHVRGGGADAGAGESGRSREDGPARCGEAGALLPRRRLDARCGCRTRRTRRCAIWCEPEKRRRKTSCARATAWASFCCATAGARPRR